ncbi:Non-specific serine/threonine protein kinase [Bertholletia excelsa]
MKNCSAIPPIIRPPETRQDNSSQSSLGGKYEAESHQRRKKQSVFSYFKAAAKKVAGVFTPLLRWQRKESKSETNRNQSQLTGNSSSTCNSAGSSGKTQSKFRYSSSYGPSNETSRQAGAVTFSIEEIRKSTNNFSPANKIGEGTFGVVYRGNLKDGSVVAIKRAKKEVYDNHSFAEYENEILTLSKIEHLNLVRLFGYLEHGEERIIVVEYVGNGTLRSIWMVGQATRSSTFECTRQGELEIAERLDIAIDVAHAITYLHTYTDPPIIHRDIKASNILITEKLRAKVADFGFARLAVEDPMATHISTQVKGTAGYLDPEYLKTYQLTPKSDVYSFGVLLVEMVTGRRPLESERSLKERVTIRWAMQRLREGEAVVAMDPRLRRSPASVMVVEKVLKLAQQCLAPKRQSRPSMKQCGEALWVIRKDLREHLSGAASASHHSENIDMRKVHRKMFGIEDSDSYRNHSA